MTKRRLSVLFMVVLMLACSLTVTAATNAETGKTENDCGGLHIFGEGVSIGNPSYEYINDSTHKKIQCYYGQCTGCGDYGEFSIPQIESHSYSTTDLVEQHHEGVYHYYTYRLTCPLCGWFKHVTNKEYCGSTCKGVHLSIPDDEN